ncbi:MAG: hypothetical protein ACD_58C00210G0002 [uncultured bacterium]|uniref:Uncharacterized protein n=1 Tax=Berkelbacteria bacterium GW2011_GWA2_38_9 TaxID=1618334 RepID=A0A0G0LDT7_9BACT|nr:MAG: hypothetical protein ACD_58C00210G0002 [uncultured bacterium]KKQ90063.1 MAG: hypothetical protein UT11_C0013G0007 [Berkelbacteria bacterium GW2011_GWA2_38_9]
MKKISTKKQLFYSIVYYPEPVNSDINWAEIKNAIGTNYRKQTVYETAKFLLDNPNFGKGNKVIEKIRKCYYCFDIQKIYSENDYNNFEACSGALGGNGILIIGGNKRIIAYAMKIINRDLKFQPLKLSHWSDCLDRRDQANKEEKNTVIDEKIECF